MILLNTGVGLVLFGTPILAIILTIIVAFIETLWLNYLVKNFWRTFKIAILVNAITTVIGFIIIILLNVFDAFNFIVSKTNLSFKLDDGLRGYLGRFLLLLVFYLLTIVIEIPLFKKFLGPQKDNIRRRILVANLLSYILIALLFFVLMQ